MAPPQTPSPCPHTSLWTLDLPCGQSQKFPECSGCWGPAGCLPPEPLASSNLAWSRQNLTHILGFRAGLSWVPAEEGPPTPDVTLSFLEDSQVPVLAPGPSHLGTTKLAAQRAVLHSPHRACSKPHADTGRVTRPRSREIRKEATPRRP